MTWFGSALLVSFHSKSVLNAVLIRRRASMSPTVLAKILLEQTPNHRQCL
jgi:hypothetical protein